MRLLVDTIPNKRTKEWGFQPTYVDERIRVSAIFSERKNQGFTAARRHTFEKKGGDVQERFRLFARLSDDTSHILGNGTAFVKEIVCNLEATKTGNKRNKTHGDYRAVGGERK